MMRKKLEDFKSPGYGITVSRIASGRAGGWEVSLERQGRRVKRHFAFAQHGGQDAALLAAQAYRDEILLKYPPMTNLQCCTNRRIDNQSGIPGVRREQRSESYAFWEANTRVRGHNLGKKFSVNVYGEEGAKQKAIAERERQLAQVENVYRLISTEARELYAKQGGFPEETTLCGVGVELPRRGKKPVMSKSKNR